MVKFLFKRVMILAVILAVTAFFIRGNDGLIAFGILLGTGVSIYKIRLFEKIFLFLFETSKVNYIMQILVNVFSQLLCFLILLVAILANIRLFFGVTIGLSLLPFVICLNGITEKAGLTHNKWEFYE